MKKIGILFIYIVIFMSLVIGCGMNKKESENKTNDSLPGWENLYIEFLKDLCVNESGDTYEFVMRDMDADKIPELIVKNQMKLTVYKYDKDVKEIGSYDFSTATTRFYVSEVNDYQGIFCFYVSGGLNHYGYIEAQNKKLKIEELWNEDYSGISKEIGEKRGKIKEISKNKNLINKSKELYNDNNDLEFIQINSEILNNMAENIESYITE